MMGLCEIISRKSRVLLSLKNDKWREKAKYYRLYNLYFITSFSIIAHQPIPYLYCSKAVLTGNSSMPIKPQTYYYLYHIYVPVVKRNSKKPATK